MCSRRIFGRRSHNGSPFPAHFSGLPVLWQKISFLTVILLLWAKEPGDAQVRAARTLATAVWASTAWKLCFISLLPYFVILCSAPADAWSPGWVQQQTGWKWCRSWSAGMSRQPDPCRSHNPAHFCLKLALAVVFWHFGASVFTFEFENGPICLFPISAHTFASWRWSRYSATQDSQSDSNSTTIISCRRVWPSGCSSRCSSYPKTRWLIWPYFAFWLYFYKTGKSAGSYHAIRFDFSWYLSGPPAAHSTGPQIGFSLPAGAGFWAPTPILEPSIRADWPPWAYPAGAGSDFVWPPGSPAGWFGSVWMASRPWRGFSGRWCFYCSIFVVLPIFCI